MKFAVDNSHWTLTNEVSKLTMHHRKIKFLHSHIETIMPFHGTCTSISRTSFLLYSWFMFDSCYKFSKCTTAADKLALAWYLFKLCNRSWVFIFIHCKTCMCAIDKNNISERCICYFKSKQRKHPRNHVHPVKLAYEYVRRGFTQHCHMHCLFKSRILICVDSRH